LTEYRLSDRAIALIVLAGAMVLSAAALLWIGRDQTIRGDNLEYATRIATQGVGHALLHTPANKYLIAVPLLVYRALFGIFGLDNYFPSRLLAIALVLISGGLFYALVRKHVGYVLAVVATVLLLFFGSGWEEVLTAIRLPSLIAVASGLGALLALGRRQLLWDVVATALLCVAVASHPTGVAFTAAATVMVILAPAPERWKRVWVVLIPAAIFVAWYLIWRTTTPTLIPNTASDVFLFVRESWVMLCATVTGLSGVLPIPVYRQPVAEVVGALLFALLVVVTVRRFRQLPALFWAALVGLAVLLVSTRLSVGGFLRRPDEVRYLYPETILFLLVLAGLAASVKLPRWVQAAVSVVLVLAIASNFAMLVNGGEISRQKSQVTTGQLSAYRIAGDHAIPSYRPTPLDTTAAQDLAAMRRFGSAGLAPSDLLSAPTTTRLAADQALVGSLGIKPEPTKKKPDRSGPTPHAVDVTAGRATHSGGCVVLFPPKGATGQSGQQPLADLSLPPAGVEVSASDLGHAHLYLGRFAPPSVLLRPVEGRFATLATPLGQSKVPWKLRVASDQSTAVCGLIG
jgi:hypothetical protein